LGFRVCGLGDSCSLESDCLVGRLDP
jgi:hypothetical protein